MIFELM